MIQWRFLILFFILAFPYLSHSAQITVQVIHPDGSPAAGIPIWDDQIAWRNITRAWQSGVTDERGMFTFDLLPKTREWQEIKADNGYGVYHLIVAPKTDYQWEVSDQFYWADLSAPDINSYIQPIEHYLEWAKHPENVYKIHDYNVVEVTPEAELTWNITLQPGSTSQVKMVDQFNEPLVNRPFRLLLDTIEIKNVQTDQQGFISLPHIHSGYVYEFETDNYFEYYPPNLDYRYGVLSARLHEGNNTVQWTKAAERLKVIVKDKETGKPIPNATVGSIMHFINLNQGGPIGKANEEGVFETSEFSYEHVYRITAWGEGYSFQEKNVDDTEAPGVYRFELDRE